MPVVPRATPYHSPRSELVTRKSLCFMVSLPWSGLHGSCYRCRRPETPTNSAVLTPSVQAQGTASLILTQYSCFGSCTRPSD
ncbi:hypothetical protein HZ326_19369 [Fusarium oxysporum f. sp. albedinis]|nr:hypothetical protein HZ326_19369 [Fusarium oxysporum f. sp. albedinis]